eukprot:984436-Prymnesium_polylepis.1
MIRFVSRLYSQMFSGRFRRDRYHSTRTAKAQIVTDGCATRLRAQYKRKRIDGASLTASVRRLACEGASFEVYDYEERSVVSNAEANPDAHPDEEVQFTEQIQGTSVTFQGGYEYGGQWIAYKQVPWCGAVVKGE